MGYYIDLSVISIEEYKTKLETAYLPPSRTKLKEKLEERFGYFKGIGIKNVEELLQALKKKDSLTEISKAKNFSEEYLKILLREINSSLPKPNKIKDFADITAHTVEKLEQIGIKNTKKLYERIKNKKSRKELSNTTGINETDILELAKLTDLSRIKWVGVAFARMLYELGVDTTEKATRVDAVDLHRKINQLSKEKEIYKGHIGLNDIKILVEAAKEVPLDIEY